MYYALKQHCRVLASGRYVWHRYLHGARLAHHNAAQNGAQVQRFVYGGHWRRGSHSAPAPSAGAGDIGRPRVVVSDCCRASRRRRCRQHLLSRCCMLFGQASSLMVVLTRLCLGRELPFVFPLHLWLVNVEGQNFAD